VPRPPLNSSRQQENDYDDEQEAGAAARAVAPTAAIRPSRQGAEQYDDQDDEEDCAEHGDSGAWLSQRFTLKKPSQINCISSDLV
jgi:hypothetical protein